MTTQEALNILIKADPSRYFSAQLSLQSSAPREGCEREFTKSFCIFVQPAYDGTACQMTDSNGDGFDAPVAQMLSYINPTPATPNNE